MSYSFVEALVAYINDKKDNAESKILIDKKFVFNQRYLQL